MTCACGCGQTPPPAKRTDGRRGLVKGQPRPWIAGHKPAGAPVGDVPAGALSQLLQPVPPGQVAPSAPRTPKPDHPKGWEPGVTWDGRRGEVCSGPVDTPLENAADWAPILALLGFDPERFTVVGDVTSKTWFMGYKNTDGQGERLQLWSHKAQIRLRSEVLADDDLADLLASILADRPPAVRPAGGDMAFIVCLADWQTGKRDGDGIRGLIGRVHATIDQVAERLAELRSQGRHIGTLIVAGLGDLVEGCAGFYPQQTHTVELDRREQVKVARRLLAAAIKAWAPLAERVVVVCVPGNHGENRADGKSFTTFADNDDVAVFEMVAEQLAENPDTYGHVTFNIPTDELVRVLDVAGTTVAFTHGHAAPSASDPAGAMWKWWQGHAFGTQPAGDASVLIAGHFHQFNVRRQHGRTLFVCPPLDGGSKWFTDRTGMASEAGTLTLLVGERGWQDVQILDGRPAETPAARHLRAVA